jgi:hypothetical protein
MNSKLLRKRTKVFQAKQKACPPSPLETKLKELSTGPMATPVPSTASTSSTDVKLDRHCRMPIDYNGLPGVGTMASPDKSKVRSAGCGEQISEELTCVLVYDVHTKEWTIAHKECVPTAMFQAIDPNRLKTPSEYDKSISVYNKAEALKNEMWKKL